MTHIEFDRERTLTELSEFGIGFSEGKPRVVNRAQMVAVSVCVFWVLALVIGLAWSRWA